MNHDLGLLSFFRRVKYTFTGSGFESNYIIGLNWHHSSFVLVREVGNDHSANHFSKMQYRIIIGFPPEVDVTLLQNLWWSSLWNKSQISYFVFFVNPSFIDVRRSTGRFQDTPLYVRYLLQGALFQTLFQIPDQHMFPLQWSSFSKWLHFMQSFGYGYRTKVLN